LEKVRIDKWLWSVRIFKSRTRAADACKSGKIRIGEFAAKPSDKVSVGEMVYVKKGGFNLEFLVKKLIEKRVGAPLAQECYDNLTPAEELSKFADWFVGKSGAERRERGSGRPTKRERREIDEFKTERFDFDF
jgi:ribosome-associated heat shock protein Hsp15